MLHRMSGIEAYYASRQESIGAVRQLFVTKSSYLSSKVQETYEKYVIADYIINIS